MLKGLQGKTVLVTGAAGGIGRAACDRLLAEGARVVAVDLNVEELRRAYGQDVVECVAADLTTAAGAAACVTAAERFGGLDLAFLNAGVEGVAANVADFSEKNFDHVFNINVRGSFLCAQAVVRHMLQRAKGGGILFTASIAGLKCNPTTAVYNASKHAVVGLAKCLASEVGGKGIRVNVLCPGVVDTRMIHSLEVSMGAGVRSRHRYHAAGDAHGQRARPLWYGRRDCSDRCLDPERRSALLPRRDLHYRRRLDGLLIADMTNGS